MLAQIWSTSTFKDRDQQKVLLDNEMDCVKNISADAKPDFADTWFKCHCIGKSSC